MDKNRIRVILIIGYFLMTLVHLSSKAIEWEELGNSSKIILIPWLIGFVYFTQNSSPSSIKSLLIGALVFSWIGDTLLIGGDQDEHLFIGGLIAFLIAHVCYIIIFTLLSNGVEPISKFKKWSMILIPVYLSGMLYYLHPLVFKSLFPAIAVYALAISLMAFTAIGALSRPLQQFHKYIFMGVVLFLMSDSILAINKFGNLDMSTNLAGFYIMSTYCAAQAMLTLGITTAWKNMSKKG
jgi:uncharacterized membrane protein YhhN